LFRIKICGITRVADAQLVALAGADAIGLNFYQNSPRCIDLATADQLVAVLPERVVKVGVFVNAPVDEVHQIADRLGLDWLQLHGDETADVLAAVGSRPVVKAFRCGEEGLAEITPYLDACRRQGRLPDGVLVDARVPDQYGGTGTTVDWQLVSQGRAALGNLPLVLAGGLTPFNVAEAIAVTRPSAVDVASGVESRAGSKDPLLVRAFVSAARKAFSEVGAGSE
jgi:phosphoribosylanthranilate isomerase